MSRTNPVTFPLYDDLSKMPVEQNINVSELSKRISAIRSKDPKSAYSFFRTAYALAIHYYILENGQKPVRPPYGITTGDGGKGVIITPIRLPPKLLNIIYHYFNKMIHLDS